MHAMVTRQTILSLQGEWLYEYLVIIYLQKQLYFFFMVKRGEFKFMV